MNHPSSGASNASAVLAAAMMGIVLVTVDVSAVNVAAITLDRSFHTGLGGMKWVLNGYTLAYAAFLLNAGALSDRHGPRATFLAGFALFALASRAHAFTAHVRIEDEQHEVTFEEHDHAPVVADRDNNMRAAVVRVIADAAVSVLVIVGLILASVFGWLWMDPLAGMIGGCAIASWSYGLIRDTGAILLDTTPDERMAAKVRQTI